MKRMKAVTLLLLVLSGGIAISAQTSRPLFEVEFFGGLSGLKPDDFNLVPESRYNIHALYYDNRFSFEQNAGFLNSWGSEITGEFKRIDGAFPFGLRLRFHISKEVALSLGIKYFSVDHTEDVRFRYTVDGAFADRIYDVSYTPSRLFTEGIVPTFGIHYKFDISRKFSFEAYLNLGMVFARGGYERHYIEDITIGFSQMKLDYIVQETGHGKGLSIEPGVEIYFRVNKLVKLFIGGGYASQKMSSLTGSGELSYIFPENRTDQSWEGDWGIRTRSHNKEWGVLNDTIPTIDGSVYAGGDRQRDFKLDLSGVQLKIGLSIQLKSKRK